ncbi:MAG TPA: protease inhibitor I9 family protein [Pyrinomonadaceae bacterium]|nr:protease inhibitor I9 family protein [Pyrinomonadaceae bacterium]
MSTNSTAQLLFYFGTLLLTVKGVTRDLASSLFANSFAKNYNGGVRLKQPRHSLKFELFAKKSGTLWANHLIARWGSLNDGRATVMQRVTICLIVLNALVLAVLPIPTLAQQQEYPRPDYPFPGFPEEFSPLRTSRPAKPQRSLTPSKKFVKSGNPISNRYIVVLKDDVVDPAASLAARRGAVTAIANAHAQVHLGKIGYIYETALIGYSIELPNEAAAIALSGDPQVKWVQEDGQVQWQDADSFQSTPPWGLSRLTAAFPHPYRTLIEGRIVSASSMHRFWRRSLCP